MKSKLNRSSFAPGLEDYIKFLESPQVFSNPAESKMTAPLTYGEHQNRGRKFQAWISDPVISGCYVGPSTLTYDALAAWVLTDDLSEDLDSQPDSDNEQVINLAQQLRLEDSLTMHVINSPSPPSPGGTPGEGNDFRFFIAPGYLFILTMFRNSGPYASQIAQAVYESSYAINTLRQVIMVGVKNADTIDFLKGRIFTAANGFVWPDSGPQTFVHGTAEYEGILGTKLGSVMAYTVLGAFTRGTRRISQISVDPSNAGYTRLAFDIEEVELPAPAKGKRRRASDDVEGGDRDEGRQKKWHRYIDPAYDGPAKRTRRATRAAKGEIAGT